MMVRLPDGSIAAIEVPHGMVEQISALVEASSVHLPHLNAAPKVNDISATRSESARFDALRKRRSRFASLDRRPTFPVQPAEQLFVWFA
ncbi:MAG TPA: hypothetical protein VEU11_10645 [Terriglobales bacterium]|nr:hypothetical protein [Terriglobales bacterium]